MTLATRINQNLVIDEARGTFRVARRAFIDPEIYERERREIFDKCWLYVGHESELKEEGRFQVRRVGGREIIFNRDANGQVNAFFNSCPHRGARLCTERSGAGKVFYCNYHGWSFRNDGQLRIVPERGDYPPSFNDDGSANMVRVARLEAYRGLYFLCYDPNAISLSEYLGDAKATIDLFLDQGEEMEIVTGQQEYATKANWKLLAENGIDGNHGEALHVTYIDYVRSAIPGTKPAPKGGNFTGPVRNLGNGHVLLEFAGPFAKASGKWTPSLGEDVKPDIEANYQTLVRRLGEERAKSVAFLNRNLLIFPNLAIVDTTGLTLRIAHPDGPHNMLVSSYALAPKEESPRVRKARLANFVEFLGPGGLATPDDIEVLEQCQHSYVMNGDFAGWNDMSKGPLSDVDTTTVQEGNIRTFWREWGRRLGDAGIAKAATPT